MPATYEPIATTTLGSAAATITFSSIPATYTDLRVVFTGTSAVGAGLYFTFNSDNSTNYSRTLLYGDGSSAASARNTSQTYIYCGFATTIPILSTMDIFSYAGSTNKTVLGQLSQDANGSGTVQSIVGLWRNTSAITSITITASSNTFATGTTATLYGIKAA